MEQLVCSKKFTVISWPRSSSFRSRSFVAIDLYVLNMVEEDERFIRDRELTLLE